MAIYEQLQLPGWSETEYLGGGITVLSAGIPCQPYSLAGKGLGDCDSRDLEQELVRIIREVKPRWVLVENTPGLFARKNQRYFNRILSDISEVGYSVGWGMWGACDVGAPHRRERVFIVCRNTDCKHADKEQEVPREKQVAHAGRNSGSLCDPHSFGRQAVEPKKFIPSEALVQKGIGHELGGADSITKPTEWWEVEPGMGRMAYGIPNRVDRLRCLGNAVVPYQALPIFEAIRKIEERGASNERKGKKN